MTTVPTQALFLMNAPFLKRRPLSWHGGRRAAAGDRARLDGLWLRVLNRPITVAEQNECVAFLAEVRDLDAGGDSAISRTSRLGRAVPCLARLERIPRASVTIGQRSLIHSPLTENPS